MDTEHPPKYRHETLEKAEAEAERLATNNPDATFVILEAIKSVRLKPEFEKEDL
jgi:hypothetical protein